LSDGSITVTAFVDEDNMASDSATLIPTQQSVKAYVDSQIGSNNELSEVLGNGNTTGGNNIQLTTTDELQFRDTALKISSSADGQLDIDADTEVEITAPTVDINASTEVNISGDFTVDTNTLHVDSANNRVGIANLSPSTALDVTGTVTATGGAFTGNVTFGDNNKAIFGTSSNLEIYGNGGYSYIDEVGANNLNIRTNGANIGIYDTANSQYMAQFTTGGGVELYHNGAQKFTTTPAGIDIGGTVLATGLTVDTSTLHVDATNNRVGIGTTAVDTKLHLEESDTTSVFLKTQNSAGALLVGNNSAGNSFVSSQTSGKPLLFETENTELGRVRLVDCSMQKILLAALCLKMYLAMQNYL
jgi:phage baseplate assembly protein gpV